VLSYAVLEGLFLGAFSFLLTNFTVSSTSAGGAMIGQAVLGTVGVFLRNARGLQDRRHPSHPEIHPDARCQHVRRAGSDAGQIWCWAMFGVGHGEGNGALRKRRPTGDHLLAGVHRDSQRSAS